MNLRHLDRLAQQHSRAVRILARRAWWLGPRAETIRNVLRNPFICRFARVVRAVRMLRDAGCR